METFVLTNFIGSLRRVTLVGVFVFLPQTFWEGSRGPMNDIFVVYKFSLSS